MLLPLPPLLLLLLLLLLLRRDVYADVLHVPQVVPLAVCKCAGSGEAFAELADSAATR